MTSPSRQRWPRGLHSAAFHGSVEGTIALLSRGSIDIDQGDPNGCSPLMYAAQEGHSYVAGILLSRGANVSIAADDGYTALHFSARDGHVVVTVDLIKAGADLEARDNRSWTPLHLATNCGHSEVMAALIEAGADVDCRSENGSTPLLMAAANGYLDVVIELLRANASPLLTCSCENKSFFPLDLAAGIGHSEVVRELIQQVGIEGCGGGSSGADALKGAAFSGWVDIMATLTDAGVVDAGSALYMAAGCSQEVAVKFLLQQRRRRGRTVDYVNTCNRLGETPLLRSIRVAISKEDVPCLISPKVVRLLIDAGANTLSAFRFASTAGGETVFHGTPLAFTSHCLRAKQVGGQEATEEQMGRLEAVRRLLLRVGAVHAVSWLWPRTPFLVGGAEGGSSRRATKKTPASATPLTLMLPMLRHRRRGVLMAPLFRYSNHP